MESNLPNTITVFVGQALRPDRSRVCGARVPKDGPLVREERTVVRRLFTVPGVPLDEARLVASDPLRPHREGVAPNVNTLPRDGVHRGADPEPVSGSLDLEVVFAAVHAVPFNFARHPSAAVGAGFAVRIGRVGAGNKAREDAVEDGLPAAVGTRLDAGVPNSRAGKLELLREVVTGDVVCLDDRDRKGDVCESRGGYIGDGPGGADQGVRRRKGAEQRRDKSEGTGEFHCGKLV